MMPGTYRCEPGPENENWHQLFLGQDRHPRISPHHEGLRRTGHGNDTGRFQSQERSLSLPYRPEPRGRRVVAHKLSGQQPPAPGGGRPRAPAQAVRGRAGLPQRFVQQPPGSPQGESDPASLRGRLHHRRGVAYQRGLHGRSIRPLPGQPSSYRGTVVHVYKRRDILSPHSGQRVKRLRPWFRGGRSGQISP